MAYQPGFIRLNRLPRRTHIRLLSLPLYGEIQMAFTTFSGPVRSVAGFAEPITYIFATDGATVKIPAGGNIVILSPADGGPVAEISLVLPLVTSNPFSLAAGQNQPADVKYAGLKGSILNYGAVAHILVGTSGQKVNGNAAGVVIPAGYGVQFGGNGNQAAPWAATNTVLSTAV